MHSPLTLSETRIETDGRALEVGGELDIATAAQFRRSIGTLLGTGCRQVVVDLSHVTFVDSSGLGALVWAAHRMRSAGGAFSVANPSAEILPTLRMTGVTQILAIVDEA